MSVLYVRDKDGNLIPVPSLAGAEGRPGADGISPTVEISKAGKVTAIAITDANGTHRAEINDGEAGADGISPTVEISKADGVTTITITDINGIHTAAIADGAGGSTGIAESITEAVEFVATGINLNDGVYEYGRFAAAGTEYDNDSPIEGAFRNVNYLPVEGGREIAIYYAAAEWNNNNVGYPVNIVQYDADKNVIGTRLELLPHAATDRPTLTLADNAAYIRISLNRSGTAITTPLDEIELAVYYLEDFVWEYVPHEVSETVYMVRRDRVKGLEPLQGKKIVYDGDSICESRISGTAANGGGYAKLIADYTGGTYDNQAVGGARLCANDEKHSVVNNLENLPTDGDLYCFQGGINDFWGNAPIGECSMTDYTGTVDPSTVCGALETIFRYCLSNLVGKPVCFVITHKIGNTAYSANTNGNTFADYREAMAKVCEKYSIPYYDAYSESGLNGWNEVQSNAYLTANSSGTGDGIHPNADGYRRYYVPQLLDLFRRMMPAD